MRNQLLILAGAALVLTACGKTGVTDRKRPDEFAVGRQAPLVVPPDFALVPPKPGAPRPIGEDSQQQALEALFGPGVSLPAKSPLEKQMLNDSGANAVDPGIRNSVARRADDPAITVDKGAFLRDLMDAPAGTRNPDIAKVTVGG